MSDEIAQLLRRPTVVAAVQNLRVAALTLEDVLTALRAYGHVRIEVDQDPEHPYVCVVDGGTEQCRGRTVLHAAVACWAEVLEGFATYTEQGFAELDEFLA